MADKVEWQFDVPDVDEALLAKCGCWRAELAHKDIYSEGLVFIKESGTSVPAHFGHPGVAIPEPGNLVRLIEQVSRAMAEGLTCSFPCKCKCENVYVTSLNEGDFKNVQEKKPQSVGVHFRLLPRYAHDYSFLTEIGSDSIPNDGFALMAHWRQQFLQRKATGKWGSFPQPYDEQNLETWRAYVERIWRQLAGPKTSRR